MSPQGAAHIENIAVVEPRCVGLEHVPFNAALVVAVIAGNPQASVTLYGETGHLEALRELLELTRPALLPRIHWRQLDVPHRRAQGWRRVKATRRMFADLDVAFQQQRPSAVVIATVDPHVLVVLKSRLFGSWSGMRALAVFHELLAVLERRRLRSWRWWSLVASLRALHPRGLRYLVLAGSIRSYLEHLAPSLSRHFLAIDHPSLLGDVPGDPPSPSPSAPVRIGFVGGGREAKGFREFVRLARTVRAQCPDVVFEVVGSAPTDLPVDELSGLSWSREKLPMPAFVHRIRQLTAVVWLGDPEHYRLVASGSLVDCLALGVPVICRSGDFVDHLFDKLGNVGIRCGSLREIESRLLLMAKGGHLAHLRPTPQTAAALRPEASLDELRCALSGGVPAH